MKVQEKHCDSIGHLLIVLLSTVSSCVQKLQTFQVGMC